MNDDIRSKISNRYKSVLLQGDSNGLFMTNYEVAADHLAKRIGESLEKPSVAEICCGVGATTISISKIAGKVFAIDKNIERIKSAKENIMKIENRADVIFLCTDAFSQLSRERYDQVDVVIADPDWSWKGHKKSDHTTALAHTRPDTEKLHKMLVRMDKKNIIYRMALAMPDEEIRKLGDCEIEVVIIDDDPKFKYVYFGELKQGIETRIELKS